MPYQFAQENRDYSDYASGRFFYGAPGQPAFPVRLGSELLQRCLAARRQMGRTGPVHLYDPCCGSAYHLCTLAYLHWQAIGAITASDIDAAMLSFADRNLGLLTPTGLDERVQEIARLLHQYGKPSHAAALASARRFGRRLQTNLDRHAIHTHLFQADATAPAALGAGLPQRSIDVVLTDVPYGRRTQWQSAQAAPAAGEHFLWWLLDALRPHINPHTVVAIAADKAQKCRHEQYRRLDQFQVGKRRLTLLQLVDGGE